MLWFVASRIAWLGPVLLGAVTVVFFLVQAVPGDPTGVLLGPTASEAAREALRQKLGLYDPLYVQYVRWMALVLQGDLGNSLSLRTPVVEIVLRKLPNTIILGVASSFVAIVVGVTLGVVSAIRRNTLLDKAILGISLFGVSMPAYWLGLVLIYFLAIEAKLFPTGGIHSLGETSLVDLAWHLVLPAIAASTVAAGILARVTRTAMLDVLNLDFLVALRAKGLSRGAIHRHAFRNALPTVVTMAGLQIGYQLLGSSLFVEIIFGWPGLGLQTYDAVKARDFPLVAGIVILSTAVFVLLNLLVDIVAALANPRSRT